MHSLLKEQVPRRLEHPMPELSGIKLTKRHTEHTANMLQRPDRPAADVMLQQPEGGVANKILVDLQHTTTAHRGGLERGAIGVTLGHGLLKQYVDAMKQEC